VFGEQYLWLKIECLNPTRVDPCNISTVSLTNSQSQKLNLLNLHWKKLDWSSFKMLFM